MVEDPKICKTHGELTDDIVKYVKYRWGHYRTCLICWKSKKRKDSAKHRAKKREYYRFKAKEHYYIKMKLALYVTVVLLAAGIEPL